MRFLWSIFSINDPLFSGWLDLPTVHSPPPLVADLDVVLHRYSSLQEPSFVHSVLINTYLLHSDSWPTRFLLSVCPTSSRFMGSLPWCDGGSVLVHRHRRFRLSYSSRRLRPWGVRREVVVGLSVDVPESVSVPESVTGYDTPIVSGPVSTTHTPTPGCVDPPVLSGETSPLSTRPWIYPTPNRPGSLVVGGPLEPDVLLSGGHCVSAGFSLSCPLFLLFRPQGDSWTVSRRRSRSRGPTDSTPGLRLRVSPVVSSWPGRETPERWGLGGGDFRSRLRWTMTSRFWLAFWWTHGVP